MSHIRIIYISYFTTTVWRGLYILYMQAFSMTFLQPLNGPQSSILKLVLKLNHIIKSFSAVKMKLFELKLRRGNNFSCCKPNKVNEQKAIHFTIDNVLDCLDQPRIQALSTMLLAGGA